MRKIKRLLTVLLALTLVFAIASCGGGGTKPCETCVDEDGDKKCDACGKDMPKEVIEDFVLFEDEEATFQVVISSDVGASARQAANTNIKMMLQREYGASVDVVLEGTENDVEYDMEILVGNVTSRGEEYCVDEHTLGKTGYTVKIIGSKIVIHAGSEAAYQYAISDFADTMLADLDDLSYVVMTEDDMIDAVQDDYYITSLSVNGTDMRGYTIAAELTRDYYEDTAIFLQEKFYEDTGYWFDIVDLEAASDKSIILRHNDSLPKAESYKISTNGSQLIIETSYDNMIEKKTTEYIPLAVFSQSGDLDFKDVTYSTNASVVYYEDFGARGDGRTDDFMAMRDAHIFANISGQTVLGDPDATYYIYNNRITLSTGKTEVVNIPIKTNVDWQGAKIIIDCSDIATFKGGQNYDMYSTSIFSVQHNDENKGVKFTDSAVLDALVKAGFGPETTKIDFSLDGWEGDYMLVPYNTQHKVFRRKGYGQSGGDSMHELIVIDKDGNLDPETPLMFTYTNIDYMTVYKLDPTTAITIKNATIETIDTRVNHFRNGEFGSAYMGRGMSVARSYTTVENIHHIVSGGYNLKERANGFEGASATGMFRASNANQVTFKNCIIPGRQKYGNSSSYNFGGNLVNKIVLDHCIQSNFWVSVDLSTGIMTGSEEYVEGAYPSMSTVYIVNDEGESVAVGMCWGIGGTNFCKNMEYLHSKISRFDAHQGLYNGKIIDTDINGMELTGNGDLILDDIRWYQYGTTVPFLYLRSDYGFTWDGDITVTDAQAYLYDAHGGNPSLIIANHKYVNWYYGYICAFPNITLDNFQVYSQKTMSQVTNATEATLFSFASGAQKMHLAGVDTVSIVLDYKDEDGDGYIDEPNFDVNLDGIVDETDNLFDMDGNGDPYNTKLKMEDYAHLPKDTLEKGITYSECKLNVNPIKPPEYLKIVNSPDYLYVKIASTAGKGISDGGWHTPEGAGETMGGFFGTTKFIYGEGENDYFYGSGHVNHGIPEAKVFKFYNAF